MFELEPELGLELELELEPELELELSDALPDEELCGWVGNGDSWPLDPLLPPDWLELDDEDDGREGDDVDDDDDEVDGDELGCDGLEVVVVTEQPARQAASSATAADAGPMRSRVFMPTSLGEDRRRCGLRS